MLDSLRARLLAAFLLPTLALLAVAGFLGYRSSRDLLEEELGRALSGQAAAIAAQLSAERLFALTPEDATGEGSRTYRSLTRQLGDEQAAIGARRVVTFDTSGVVGLDVGGTLPLGAEMPELARDRLELSQVFRGQRASSQVLFEGTDGRLYKTGYAPIVRDGAVLGAVAVEGSAEFFGPLRQLFQAYAALLGLTLLVLAASAVLSGRALAGPLEQLVQGALRISKGDLTTPVQPQPTREIGILARELEAMRIALDSRDRQLKMMLGGIAHEVKNPLGGIELFAGLLAEELGGPTPDAAEAREHVRKVQRELDYLKRIVDDFLSFAREQKVATLPFAARALLQGAADVLAAEAQARGVRLEVRVDDATLQGDVSLLTSALVNLVKNAVQASPSGQAVRVTGQPTPAGYAIEVEDAGPGIAPEVQTRIFEPFFTTREQGTGLGLPLARKLFEAHHGTLSVESSPGRTVFRATCPFAKDAPKPG